MGDPRRQKQKYAKPKRPFETERFEQELELLGSYGLRNKREIWRHRAELSNYRRQARRLQALPPADRVEEEKTLLDKVVRFGLLKSERSLEGILDLTLRDMLERRLQTIVFRKGYASSMYHARQLIVHGHVALDQARVRTPSRIISLAEESRLSLSPRSPLNDPSHPARIAASAAAERASMVEPEPREEEPGRRREARLDMDEDEREPVVAYDSSDLGPEDERI
ncbi:MAG: 30S ribosomal protein S4 [Candidatus Thorarchaeota archaeon]|nr:30S ribosomal protein S4 [Candidatus Thorarchaeota archaeon]